MALCLGERMFAVGSHDDLAGVARLLGVRVLVAGHLHVSPPVRAVEAERHQPAAAFPDVDPGWILGEVRPSLTAERRDQRRVPSSRRDPHEVARLSAESGRREILLPLFARTSHDDQTLTVGGVDRLRIERGDGGEAFGLPAGGGDAIDVPALGVRPAHVREVASVG